MLPSRRSSSGLVTCVCAALLAAPPAAWADEGPSLSAASSSSVFHAGGTLPLGATATGPNRFSSFRVEAHLDFGWYGMLGVGVRLEVPLAPSGILTEVDDELALSFGAELFYFYGPRAGPGVYPIVALQWNFFVGSNVSLFPELGVAFLFGPGRDAYWGTFVAPFFGLGFRYHFNARNALLLRVSWPAGLQVGVTF